MCGNPCRMPVLGGRGLDGDEVGLFRNTTLRLSVCECVSVSVCLCQFVRVDVLVCLCLSVCVRWSVCLSVAICVSVFLSMGEFVFMFARHYVCVSLSVSSFYLYPLSVISSVQFFFVCLYKSVFQSAYLSICLCLARSLSNSATTTPDATRKALFPFGETGERNHPQ